jgi:hypothetical protein
MAGGPDIDGESHRDMWLAELAQLGLPLSTPLRAGEGTFTLRDVLIDSIANFTLQQEEIHWTAIAYCLYLPPQKAWRDRDGNVFAFDDLAKELLGRPLSRASCGGAHVLEAMTFLVRVDAEVPCLSTSSRQSILDRLRNVVSKAVTAQSHEGFWTAGWDTSEPALHSSLLVTGHVAECLQYLPRDLQPGAETYRRAAQWLCAELQRRAGSFGDQEVCPWTHAVCSVRNLIGWVAE